MVREDQAALARAAILARFEREVDPDRKLPPEERAKLVRAAARRYSAKLNAAKARKRAARCAPTKNSNGAAQERQAG